MVARSNKNPIKKVFTKGKKLVSTSEKFQIKKLNRTKKETSKNSPEKAINKVKRDGNIFDIRLILDFWLRKNNVKF